MRIARKLFLLTAMAISALAMTAGAANAQETPVELSNEATGIHCGATPANCVVHAVSISDSVIVSHIFGSESVASTCQDEFTAVLNENGTGSIINQVLRQGPNGTCSNTPCEDGPVDPVGTPPRPWAITAPGETSPNVGHMTVNFCLEPVGHGTERSCLGEVQITEPTPHNYVFSMNQHCPIFTGVESEVSGNWAAEDSNIEITHL